MALSRLKSAFLEFTVKLCVTTLLRFLRSFWIAAFPSERMRHPNNELDQ